MKHVVRIVRDRGVLCGVLVSMQRSIHRDTGVEVWKKDVQEERFFTGASS